MFLKQKQILTTDQIKSWIEQNLRVVKWTGYQALCHSPFREDKHPSFSINAEKRTWYDHATEESGSLKQLCDKLGKPYPWDNVYNPGKRTSKETIYQYKDEQEKLLFESVRIDYFNSGYKKIFQRQPDGKGRYINSLRGVRLIPYRLPELIKALETGEKRVFIPEGEKCVDLLRELGLTATCNPMGAGKWKEEYNQFFPEELEIIILPDADKPGQKHAQKTAESLLLRRCKIKVVNLDYPIKEKNGEDIYDWIKQDGHTKNKLLKLVELTPDWREVELDKLIPKSISGEELWSKKFPKPKWIIPEIIPEGTTIFAGPPKIGKSYFALQIAIATATGGYILNKKIEKGDVLYFALEDNQRRLQQRLLQLAKAPPKNLNFFDEWTWASPDSSIQESSSTLELCLQKYQNTKLVIIDTLQRFRGGKYVRGNAYANDYSDLLKIKNVAGKYGISLIIIHHTRKTIIGENIDVFEKISGTFGIQAAVDTLAVLTKTKGNLKAGLHLKGRDTDEQHLILEFDPDAGWQLLGDAEEFEQSEQRIEIYQLLKESDLPMSPKEIAETLGKNVNTVYTYISRMTKQGKIARLNRGKYTIATFDK